MSDLQNIAAKLREFASSTDAVVSEVLSSSRRLKSIASEVDSLRRAGIDVGNLPAAVDAALRSAAKAEQHVRVVKAESNNWADSLAARSGGSRARVASSEASDRNLPRSRERGSLGDNVRAFIPSTSNPAVLKTYGSLLRALVSKEVAELWVPTAVGSLTDDFLGEVPAEALTLAIEDAYSAVSQGATSLWARAQLTALQRRIRRYPPTPDT